MLSESAVTFTDLLLPITHLGSNSLLSIISLDNFVLSNFKTSPTGVFDILTPSISPITMNLLFSGVVSDSIEAIL